MINILVEDNNEETKSILAQALMSDQFKNNNSAKNTITRANDLLSDLNNSEVQARVTNNGQVELLVTSNDKKGSLQILISSPSDKIKVYSNGTLEITDELIQLINEIKKH